MLRLHGVVQGGRLVLKDSVDHYSDSSFGKSRPVWLGLTWLDYLWQCLSKMLQVLCVLQFVAFCADALHIIAPEGR